ncbi:MAG: hypothetical protein HFE76_10565 [Firmicutes bacterium]|nr:hypothetical protein [Bacillota bacterium]
MNIIMPSEEEKSRSVAQILETGLPRKRPLRLRLPRLVRSIGLRNLFWGTYDCIFIAVLGSILLSVLFAIPSAYDHQLLPLSLFLISPALYGLLHLLTIWKELQIGLYSIKMTCYYTLKELTALRMVFFGGANALLDVVFVAVLSQREDMFLSFFQMLSISLSALFLYGTATLFALSHVPGNRQWIVPALWCAVCAAPAIFGMNVLGLLMKLPYAAALFAALLAAALFFAKAEHYLSLNHANHKGGIYHAVG